MSIDRLAWPANAPFRSQFTSVHDTTDLRPKTLSIQWQTADGDIMTYNMKISEAVASRFMSDYSSVERKDDIAAIASAQSPSLALRTLMMRFAEARGSAGSMTRVSGRGQTRVFVALTDGLLESDEWIRKPTGARSSGEHRQTAQVKATIE